jgi:glycosyltransferase involved in cell wall biosynthesis
MSKSPLFPQVGVIALVSDQWGDKWMSRHQILTRLATYFHVLWVNPSSDWHEFPNQAALPAVEVSLLPENFRVYQAERWLPRFYKPAWLANLTFRTRLRHARQMLLQRGCQKIILYLWRPEFAGSLDWVPFNLSCYHIVDEYSFSEEELPVSEQEGSLIRRVDHVFVHTQALLEKKGRLSRSVNLIPNGVAYRDFATAVPEPANLAPIPRPRIGYAGFLKKTLDWELLSALAQRHPDYSFVFVGDLVNHDTAERGVSALSRFPNVYFLGCVTTLELAHYPQHFDVAIMPYVLNDYTKYIYPLKLHEYLASGSPVVASPIRLLQEFERIIRLCNTVDDWSLGISQALQHEANSFAARSARQTVARKYDWNVLTNRVAQVFCRKLDLPQTGAPPELQLPATDLAYSRD